MAHADFTQSALSTLRRLYLSSLRTLRPPRALIKYKKISRRMTGKETESK